MFLYRCFYVAVIFNGFISTQFQQPFSGKSLSFQSPLIPILSRVVNNTFYKYLAITLLILVSESVGNTCDETLKSIADTSNSDACIAILATLVLSILAGHATTLHVPSNTFQSGLLWMKW